MKRIWEAIQRGYLWCIAPAADFLVRRRVSPNMLTAVGTLCSIAVGIIYATGHIRTAGVFLGLTALFDVLDGTVARRTGTTSQFGAFWDSTLDRVADGAVLGGLMIFYARDPVHHSMVMVSISLLAVIGAFVTSYTRSRAENIGIDAKVGVLQRPERVTLLSAPQAFFGLLWDGYVLAAIVTLLCVTACITACQRIAFVHQATLPNGPTDRVRESADANDEPYSRASAQPALKGE